MGIGAPGVLQIVFGLVPPDWLAYGPIPIVIVLAANYFAYSFLLASAAFTTIDSRLEEAAELHGAGFAARMRRILFPLTKQGFFTGFVLSFVSIVKDLSLVVLLVTPQTFGYVDLGQRQFADAIGVVIVVIILGCTFSVQWLTRTNPFSGFGGQQQ